MKSYTTVFKPEAEGHLDSLYDYIAGSASDDVAARYIDAIIADCLALSHFPQRGTARDDLSPGLRSISHRRRAVIVFTIEGDRVVIIGIFYGGQDWETALAN